MRMRPHAMCVHAPTAVEFSQNSLWGERGGSSGRTDDNVVFCMCGRLYHRAR